MAQTLSVGCKLPHGLIITVGGTDVTLAGTNASNVIGGYGITENVDKELFETWLASNKEAAAVKNELIFAHGKTQDVKAQASSNAKNKNGFEGLDPEKPVAGIAKDEGK